MLTDVGFGVSQVLSVIVLLHCAPEGSTVLLEQPEIHLHPLAQAGLADVIITAAARRKIQIIFESHSKRFLLRLQRRVAERRIESEDVALYFCDVSRFATRVELLSTYSGILKTGPIVHDDAFMETAKTELARSERMRMARDDSLGWLTPMFRSARMDAVPTSTPPILVAGKLRYSFSFEFAKIKSRLSSMTEVRFWRRTGDVSGSPDSPASGTGLSRSSAQPDDDRESRPSETRRWRISRSAPGRSRLGFRPKRPQIRGVGETRERACGQRGRQRLARRAELAGRQRYSRGISMRLRSEA